MPKSDATGSVWKYSSCIELTSSNYSCIVSSDQTTLVVVVVFVVPLVFWCRGLQWLPTVQVRIKMK